MLEIMACSVEMDSPAQATALRYFLRAMGLRFYTSDCSVPGRWLKHFSIECNMVEKTKINDFLTAIDRIVDEAEMELLRKMNEEEV